MSPIQTHHLYRKWKRSMTVADIQLKSNLTLKVCYFEPLLQSCRLRRINKSLISLSEQF